MITITAKIQLYPDKDQQFELEQTGIQYKKACNFLSKRVYESKELTQRVLHDRFYHYMREEFGLKSQLSASVIKTVIARYKSAKSNGHKWSQVVFKKNHYDLVWNRDYSLNDQLFSINTLNGRLKTPYQTKGMEQYFEKDSNWTFGTAQIIYKYDKWFLHVPVTKETESLEYEDVSHVVGVDLGVNFLATTYDSNGNTSFFSGKQMKNVRAKYKKLRKELSQKQTSSSRKRLKQIGSRENRYVKDVNHQVTKALVESHPKGTVFVLEEIKGVRNATEKVRVKDRYMMVSWAFHQFRTLLTYKAEMNGQKVITIDPRYTSQTCPKCGHVERGNRNKKTHTFCCKSCSYTSNDDRIGAMNIFRKGIEKISDKQSAD